MVDVVQLVEHRIVVPSVVGSSPIIHPIDEAAEPERWLRPCRFLSLPILGCSQAVKARDFDSRIAGSIPAIPASVYCGF